MAKSEKPKDSGDTPFQRFHKLARKIANIPKERVQEKKDGKTQ